MKLSHALLLASSLAFLACGDDDSNPASAKSDCSVADGVKVVSPAKGDVFNVNDVITIVYGSTVDGSGYRFVYMASEDADGVDLFDGSAGLDGEGDGKTCYEVKAKLDSEKGVKASSNAFIRVIPYERTNKRGDSEKFTVK